MSERETLENHVHITDNYSPDYCCWTELDGTTCGIAIHDEPDMEEVNYWSNRMPPALTDTNALAQYNAERARGIVHHPEWVDRMAELQAFFNATEAKRLVEEINNPPKQKCGMGEFAIIYGTAAIIITAIVIWALFR